jgi:histidyl-tRNA synthetase
MSLNTQPYKGARDFYPHEKRVQNWIFESWRHTCRSFGFLEYDGPFIEPFEMYAAKTGDEIVNTQLYSFIDRGDRKVAIRPEMTPTLARMVAAKVQELPKPIRWFSIPNLWRYEKPQKGRLREHWQLNVDILGGDRLGADRELISLALSLFDHVGARGQVTIQVNNRRLMDFLFLQAMKLNLDQALQVSKAIDNFAKITPQAFQGWLEKASLNTDQIGMLNRFLNSDLSQVSAFLPCEGLSELHNLLDSFKGRDDVRFNPTIMRGMDYYTGNVFEAYDVSPENKRALCGGGRYDNLVGLFSKNSLSGVGFGLGDVTFFDFLQTHNLLPKFKSLIDVFVACPKVELMGLAQSLCENLRNEGFSVISPLSADSFGAHLKMAAKSECHFALLLGEEELSQKAVQVKNLLSGQQARVLQSEIKEYLRKSLTET